MQMHHSSNTSPPLFSHHHSFTDITTTTTTPLFEKSLTPSDVGKLNRLVIPKQHAEKHFPLNNNSSSSSSSNDKGMLLSFEDDSGKCWRFRYSYWNSSQSYVLTKGWSRFVKDKELDPGDVVFFHRHLSDSQRLFIGCRRRAQNQIIASSNYSPYHPQLNHYYSHYGAAATAVTETHSIPSPVTVGSSRTVRLFGVNLECQLDDDGDDDTSAVSTDVEPPCTDGYYGQNMYYYHLQTPPTMMGMAVSRDETGESIFK